MKQVGRTLSTVLCRVDDLARSSDASVMSLSFMRGSTY
jgi:hypothetical protein